jgi:drug/metabolite transporter (DMT)-like permease
VYYSLLKRVPASRLALISYLFPIVALFIDVVIVHERLGQRALLGSALVLGGVAIAGLRRRGEIAPTGASRA